MKKFVLSVLVLFLFCFAPLQAQSGMTELEVELIELEWMDYPVINESGQIAGHYSTTDGYDHAFLYNSGTIDLGTLGGSVNKSDANAINNSGHIVGDSNASIGYRAFLYKNADEGMIDLGTLGGDRSSALDINNSGQIIGWSVTASGDYHAFLYKNAIVLKDCF
ncbi:MAG: hypothetical protein GY749_16230 [Desulfobacteraceae bacterium]|nr:hypothetical protein [Desulfobacteraceae bacterium]